MTTRLPGLKMPDLSAAMSSSVGPSTSVWSKLMLVTTATSPSTTFVQSHRPPSPTSTTATSTASLANQASAAAVSSSNRVGRSSINCSIRARDSSSSVKARSSIGSPLRERRSLTRLEVRAGVRADTEALSAQQGRGHGRRRALAVGAGDVQRPDRPVPDCPAVPSGSACGRDWATERLEGMPDSKSMWESSQASASGRSSKFTGSDGSTRSRWTCRERARGRSLRRRPYGSGWIWPEGC